MRNQRQTRIVATLGPATDPPGVLHELLSAGLNVARINFSHGKREDHERRIAALRAAAADLGHDVAVLADLSGPKVRVRSFRSGPVLLETGARFCIDGALGEHDGTQDAVGTDYATGPPLLPPASTLLKRALGVPLETIVPAPRVMSPTLSSSGSV